MDSVLGMSLPFWVKGAELADENERIPHVCVCINSAFGFHCDYLANASYKNSLCFPGYQMIRKAWRVCI